MTDEKIHRFEKGNRYRFDSEKGKAAAKARWDKERTRPQEEIEEQAAAILAAFSYEWETAPDHLKVWGKKAVAGASSDLKIFVEHLRSLGESEDEREVEVVINASDEAVASLVRALEICAS